MARKKIVAVFGTRPEAIKMAPLVIELAEFRNDFDVKVCVTGQHKAMLYQALDIFKIKPDDDLEVMTENQSLSTLTSNLLLKLTAYMQKEQPDLILVHGDTTTSFAGGLVGFYLGIPVGHVEAGLRTSDLQAPFPEEFNRRVTGMIADMHFAPTDYSAQNLLRENVPEGKIFVTGNTIVDALKYIESNLLSSSELATGLHDKYRQFLSYKHPVLVTTHRRENFGGGLEGICDALMDLVKANSDISIVFPVHLNPKVRDVVFSRLGTADARERIMLIDPIDYIELLFLLANCSFVVTDSGGLQEEAPSFGKYVFILRDKTERPEACRIGLAELVGSDRSTIVERVLAHVASPRDYHGTDFKNPYGSGEAARNIRVAIQKSFAL
jgi:UDP-N-acetylglucosamine 2-epimerase (non-hydrolysing)